MHVVYLTGGLASGKSTVLAWLHEAGAVVFDLDQIAREEQQSDAVLAELKQAFGDDIVDEGNTIVRSLLAERAFATEEATRQLNSICWPPVIKRVADYIKAGRSNPSGDQQLVVFEIPLLVEAAAQAPELILLADEIITVSASEQLRIDRAVQRGMSSTDASNRIARQTSDQEREAIATTVFHNTGSLDDLRMTVDRWLALAGLSQKA
jgi:dephospho-CoA kinase